MRWVIKERPEDFVVEEDFQPEINEEGEYAYYLINKQGVNTAEVVDKLAAALKVRQREVTFAGMKDKQAVASQWFSVRTRNAPRVVKSRGFTAEFRGRGKARIMLGANRGNRFRIVVRNAGNEELERITLLNGKDILFPNYFDAQRFGRNNLAVGLAILKGNFEEALRLTGESTEKNAVDFFRRNHRSSRIFIHAVQSYIFNSVLSERVGSAGADVNVDGLLFSDKMERYRKVGEEYGTLAGFDCGERNYLEEMKALGIDASDFIVRAVPQLSSESVRRRFFERTRINVRRADTGDAFEAGFSLGKGSYATILIKQLYALTCYDITSK